MLYPLSCGARDPINRGVLPSLAKAENDTGVINLWASVPVVNGPIYVRLVNYWVS